MPARAGGVDDGESSPGADPWRARSRNRGALPAALLERLALALLRVLVLVVLGFVAEPADDLELQA